MFTPDFVIFHVNNPETSSTFYQGILEVAPIESSPTFVMFALPSGLKVGLWSRHTVEPKATPPGGCELAFSVEDAQTAKSRCEQWRKLGASILQEPVEMDFGYTFTAADPDGNRLRVFAPNRE